MIYAIGMGGVVGTLMLYWAIADINYIMPRWRRYALGLAGVVLMLAFWIVRPVWQHHGATSPQECWDGHSNTC